MEEQYLEVCGQVTGVVQTPDNTGKEEPFRLPGPLAAFPDITIKNEVNEELSDFMINEDFENAELELENYVKEELSDLNMTTEDFEDHLDSVGEQEEFLDETRNLEPLTSSLSTHINTHEAKNAVKLICITCKREFKHQAFLDNHSCSVHKKKEGFTCKHCGESLENQESLDKHEEVHKTDKKHSCKFCNKSFDKLSTLKDHIQTHTSEKSNLCSICGSSISPNQSQSQNHQGLKPFKCDKCKRSKQRAVARLSRSRTRSRSRSVTPEPELELRSRRCLDVRGSAPLRREPEVEEVHNILKPTIINQAMPVEKTPTRRAVEKTPTRRAVEKTPTRRAVEKTPARRAVEKTPTRRAMEMDLDEEEGEVVSQTTHITKCLQDIPKITQPGSSGIQQPVPSTSGITRDIGSESDSEFDDEFDLEEYTANKMPETEPQLAEAMSRAMDNAVERLADVSKDFFWRADYNSFKGRPEVFSGPTPGPVHNYDDPYEAFTSIFNSELMEIIVRETNRYARQTIDARKAKGQLKITSRLGQWTDTNVDEMYVFIAIFILMGIDVRSSVHEYWLTTGILQMPMFRQLMSYDRYMLLSKFLHFTDSSAPQNLPLGFALSAKVARLAPVISHLNRQFSTLYNLHQDVAIDESLTLFKGRLSWTRAIRPKAARSDIKSFELCDSRTGYLYKFTIYAGRNPIDNDFIEALAGKTAQVVLDLLRGLEHRGHLVTMDNFYNCPTLTRYLKSLGFDNLGTLRPNRKHVPAVIAKAPENVAKGTIIARHSGDVSCIAWKDSQMVNMISSYHTDETYVGRRAGKDLVKPIAVRDYNNTMGFVDLKDQKLSMYLLERKKCVKWYVKMFKRILNASVLNAFIMLSESLGRRSLPSMTHRMFRYQLAESLAQKHCQSFRREIQTVESVEIQTVENVEIQTVENVEIQTFESVETQTVESVDTKPLRLRRNIMHVPLATRGKDNRTLCRICLRNDIRKKVHSRCDTCDEFMCLGDCWVTWHSAEQLPGREVLSFKKRRK